MDAFDRLRHRLIRWISCGDFMILNGEQRSDGRWVSKNLGPMYLAFVDVELGDGRLFILNIGKRERPVTSNLHIDPIGRQGAVIHNLCPLHLCMQDL